MNMVAKKGLIAVKDMNELSFNPTTVEMTLDLSAIEFDAARIEKAKLAILAVNKNFEEELGAGNYKLWIRFEGLPANAEVPATTAYPYTSASPIVKSLEKALINVYGQCPRYDIH